MSSLGLIAALTVATAPGLGCPEENAIVERLRLAGVVIRDDEAIRIQFSSAEGKRVAEIATPGATPRRIEHAGPDCSSLADATVALLSVLLDEREPALRERHERAPSRAETETHPVFRGEAGSVFASGIVASVGVGAMLGVAWRPARWGTLGLSAETWPARDHAVGEGTVTTGASTLAVVGCAGPSWRTLSLEGCALFHGGLYRLSASNFAIVRPAERALFGGEAAVRVVVPLAYGVGVFARAGLWLPLTRLDVTVRGASSGSGFATTSIAPKGAVGLELNL